MRRTTKTKKTADFSLLVCVSVINQISLSLIRYDYRDATVEVTFTCHNTITLYQQQLSISNILLMLLVSFDCCCRFFSLKHSSEFINIIQSTFFFTLQHSSAFFNIRLNSIPIYLSHGRYSSTFNDNIVISFYLLHLSSICSAVTILSASGSNSQLPILNIYT